MNDHLFSIVLLTKIQKNKSILNIDNNELFNNIIIKKELIIKNIKLENLELEKEEIFYDYIIIYNLFSNLENIILKTLEKIKKLLKKNGHIIFINDIITRYVQYYYHPFSYLRYILFGKCIYFCDIYDKIRQYELNIIDSDRLYTIGLWTYPIEYFSIICEVKL
jgi:hypothetical protein